MTIREAVVRALEHYTIDDGSNEMFFQCVDRICAEMGKEVAAIEAERDALRAALERIFAIKNRYSGCDWDEIEEARQIANTALKDQP